MRHLEAAELWVQQVQKAGRITIDEQDVSTVDLDSLRRTFSVVPQDVRGRGDDACVVVLASRDILAGEEIFTAYSLGFILVHQPAFAGTDQEAAS